METENKSDFLELGNIFFGFKQNFHRVSGQFLKLF